MNSTILVTGATGFIGSRLVEKLIAEGFYVTSLLRSGKIGHPKSEVIRGDLTDPMLAITLQAFPCLMHLML